MEPSLTNHCFSELSTSEASNALSSWKNRDLFNENTNEEQIQLFKYDHTNRKTKSRHFEVSQINIKKNNSKQSCFCQIWHESVDQLLPVQFIYSIILYFPPWLVIWRPSKAFLET